MLCKESETIPAGWHRHSRKGPTRDPGGSMDEDFGGVHPGMAQEEASVDFAATSGRMPRKSNRRRVWIVAVAALLGIVLVLVGIKAAQIRSMINAGKSFAPPPESVTSAKVQATA